MSSPTTIEYAIPIPKARLPWWMVVSSTLFYLACAGILLICAADVLHIRWMADAIVAAIVLMLMFVEWLALRRSGSLATAVILVVSCVSTAQFVTIEVFGILLLSNGGPTSRELALLSGDLPFIAAGAFVTITHFQWWRFPAAAIVDVRDM